MIRNVVFSYHPSIIIEDDFWQIEKSWIYFLNYTFYMLIKTKLKI